MGAVLVIALLAKGDVDGLAARTGGSAVSVILLAFSVAAGSRLSQRSGYRGLFGGVTVVIGVATFLLLAIEIWSKHPLHEPTRTVVMAVLSLLLGSICLLLGSSYENEEGPLRWARGVAVLGLLALGTLSVLGASGVDIGPRLGGLAAAAFLIPAVSLPALRALGRA